MAIGSPLIESLTLTSCISIGPDILKSLQRLEHLTYLDLSYTFFTNLEPVSKSCLKLKVLKLQACKDLADDSLKPLYRNNALPALQNLDLSHESLSQSAITELLLCCTRLRQVNLNGCMKIHDFDHWSASFLQNLNCVGCPNIYKFVMSRNARLTSLNLSLSRKLMEVKISCPSLRKLDLSRCGSLQNLKLDCPRLTSLLLQSSSINQDVLEDAILQCTMLTTLDVRNCPKIHPGSKTRLRALRPKLTRLFITSISA